MHSLIPYEQCEDEDLRQRLRDLEREKFNKALEHLITGKTNPEDFPDSKIPKRPARGGMTVDYIPGWWFDEKANALFHHLWSFEVEEQDIGKEQIWVRGKVKVAVPGRTVIEKFPDGRVVETKTEGLEIVKTQYGGSDIKKSKNTGAVIDIADDLKSASTDCKKKCLTSFGFGADIYGRREILEQTGVTSSQLDSLYKVGEKAGKSREDIDKLIQDKYGKPPNELEVLLILGLIQELREGEGK